MAAIQRSMMFLGEIHIVACDGRCDKAWGVDDRPTNRLGSDHNDFEWLADGELGQAPIDPGSLSSDNGVRKPLLVRGPDDVNEWCVDRCERMAKCRAVTSERAPDPPDLSRRRPNFEWRRTS